MHWKFDTLLESSRLKDPMFDLPRWYRQQVVHQFAPEHQQCFLSSTGECMGYALADGAARILEDEVPWPPFAPGGSPRYEAWQISGSVRVIDHYLDISIDIPDVLLENVWFDLPNFYARHARRRLVPSSFSQEDLEGELDVLFAPCDELVLLELCAAAVAAGDGGALAAIQRNAAAPRDFKRLIPEPAVVVVKINGQSARALLDSGSLSDFMSAKFAHQIDAKVFELAKPLPVHLAVQGSRAKINYGCRAVMEYQRTRSDRYFDIVNLLNYDLILGTPFLYQHRISLSFNPTAVLVGSDKPLAIEGKQVRVLESRAADVREGVLDAARQQLREYAAPICQEASDSPLPPLRAINHQIPLKDEHKIYSWRPSKCPDAHRASWMEKRDAYLKS
ncbi:uncharacterized protein TRAVEDRAFT_115206, partial [Trametes versicolor FP-101664 SS1]|uniref:uncharacterized protein n=1 Tax=Trametes versicolor (strain FP-101664) TaxID=717944 RepID=UPI0004624068